MVYKKKGGIPSPLFIARFSERPLIRTPLARSWAFEVAEPSEAGVLESLTFLHCLVISLLIKEVGACAKMSLSLISLPTKFAPRIEAISGHFHNRPQWIHLVSANTKNGEKLVFRNTF